MMMISLLWSHVTYITQNHEYFQYSDHSNQASQADRDCLKWTLKGILIVLAVLLGLRNFPSIYPLLGIKMMERLRRTTMMINWSRNLIPSAGEVSSKLRPMRRETFCLESVMFMTRRKIRGMKFFTMKSQVQTIRQMMVWSKNFQGCPHTVGSVTDSTTVKYIE